jgi:glucose/arabinose dehydrogenase
MKKAIMQRSTRPAGLAVLPDGSLLVADDAANTIWHMGKE